MSDIYGLRVWDAAGKLQFSSEGRYFRLHTTLTHVVAAGGARLYSFTVSVPGSTNDGTWTLVTMGSAFTMAIYGSFSAGVLTVTVRVYQAIAARTVQLWIFSG